MNRDIKVHIAAHSWFYALGAGLVGGVLPMLGAYTFLGAGLMIFFLSFPFAWAALTLGWERSLLVSCVAGLMVSMRYGWEGGALYAASHGMPFVILAWAESEKPWQHAEVSWVKRIETWHIWMGIGTVLTLSLQIWGVDFLQKEFQMAQQRFHAEGIEFPFSGDLRIVAGWLGMLWGIYSVLNALLVRSFNRSVNLSYEPHIHLGPLEFNKLFVQGLVGLGIAALWFKNFWALSVFMICLLPGLFKGCEIVHAFAHTRSMPRLFLGVFYGMMLGVVWFVPLVAVLGLLEPWLQLKIKISTLSHRQGE